MSIFGMGGLAPHFPHHAREIAAKNLGDAGVRMAPAREHCGERVKTVGGVEVWDEGVELCRPAMLKNALRDRVGDPFPVVMLKLRRALGWRYPAIGADADVILAAYIYGVFDVGDDIARHRLCIDAQIGPEDNAGDAAAMGQRPQRGVVDITR